MAGGAGDDLEAGFVVSRIKILSLRFHDVHDLFARDFADFRFVRLLRTSGDVGRFLQQNRSGRTFGDESERLVFKNRDYDREDVAGLFLGGGVKFLAERHDVDAARSERGANGRRRVRLAGRDLQFDVSDYFFCHWESWWLLVDS